MSLKFDREIMSWFDAFFENRKESISIDNFVCSLQGFNRNDAENIVVLEKDKTAYWRIEFSLTESYVTKLRKNVHPLFGGYIYEEISIYSDDRIYDFINYYLTKIFDNVVSYLYQPSTNSFFIDYRDEFIRKSKLVDIGKITEIDEDLYILLNSNSNIDFFNLSKSFKLNLSFDPTKGEDLLDSLIDLRRSVILND